MIVQLLVLVHPLLVVLVPLEIVTDVHVRLAHFTKPNVLLGLFLVLF